MQRLRPDVVTMDLGLPGDGGLGAIEQIMAGLPTPILVLSARVTCAGSAAAVESLLAGAVEALPKPERWDAEAERQLRCRVRLLSGVTVVAHPRGRRRPPAPDPYRAPPVAIAASTGGPAALAEILPSLGGLAVPVLVVQHLHPQLVDGFVGWMQRVSALPVVVAADGDRPQPGIVYIAPAGAHLKLVPAPGLSGIAGGAAPGHPDRRPPPGPRPRPARPAPAVGRRAVPLGRRHRGRAGVGVLLTGMGDDGAAGLLALRRQGARDHRPGRADQRRVRHARGRPAARRGRRGPRPRPDPRRHPGRRGRAGPASERSAGGARSGSSSARSARDHARAGGRAPGGRADRDRARRRPPGAAGRLPGRGGQGPGPDPGALRGRPGRRPGRLPGAAGPRHRAGDRVLPPSRPVRRPGPRGAARPRRPGGRLERRLRQRPGGLQPGHGAGRLRPPRLAGGGHRHLGHRGRPGPRRPLLVHRAGRPPARPTATGSARRGTCGRSTRPSATGSGSSGPT